jgi:hypothetical protein
MTTLREAAQQALEALCRCTPEQRTASDDLRAALAQEQQEQRGPVAWVDETSIAWLAEHPRGIITTRLVLQKSPERQMPLYTHPPHRETEQEPVAWRYKGMIGSPWSLSDDGYYASCKRDKGYIVENLYTHPPHREWRSLSEEEIAKVWCGAVMAQSTKEPGLGVIGFARAVETKLKEKNNG